MIARHKTPRRCVLITPPIRFRTLYAYFAQNTRGYVAQAARPAASAFGRVHGILKSGRGTQIGPIVAACSSGRLLPIRTDIALPNGTAGHLRGGLLEATICSTML